MKTIITESIGDANPGIAKAQFLMYGQELYFN